MMQLERKFLCSHKGPFIWLFLMAPFLLRSGKHNNLNKELMNLYLSGRNKETRAQPVETLTYIVPHSLAAQSTADYVYLLRNYEM